MKAYRFGVLILGTFTALPLPAVSAEPLTDVEPRRERHILVQAELDYLPGVERPITLEVDKAEPAAVLKAIREKSGLAIEVQGTLPKVPVLSASYRDTKTRVVLEWFAEQVPSSFRAEPPNTLWVIVEARGKSPAG